MAKYICSRCSNFTCPDCEEWIHQQQGWLSEHPIIALTPEHAAALEKLVLKPRDEPPLALTDQHAAALERAIRAEGYKIFVDTETGDVELVKTSRGD